MHSTTARSPYTSIGSLMRVTRASSLYFLQEGDVVIDRPGLIRSLEREPWREFSRKPFLIAAVFSNANPLVQLSEHLFVFGSTPCHFPYGNRLQSVKETQREKEMGLWSTINWL
jgi:hypothetical protein